MGISVKKRVTDTRVHTDVKEVVTSLRASRVCEAEASKLQALGDALAIQRAKQELQNSEGSVLQGCQQAKAEGA